MEKSKVTHNTPAASIFIGAFSVGGMRPFDLTGKMHSDNLK
jgi:hypothetical protein